MTTDYGLFGEMRRMQHEMDTLFKNVFATGNYFSNTPLLTGPSNTGITRRNYRMPLTDLTETDKEIMAKVEIPGVKKEDINVNVRPGGLEINVGIKDERKNEDMTKGAIFLERTYRGFQRYISLPDNADMERANATYRDGILELKIPKKEMRDSKMRHIRIE